MFLFASGVIARGEKNSREVCLIAETVTHLSNMNGTYKRLDETFRAAMREALGCANDTQVKRTYRSIATHCSNAKTLHEQERERLARLLSRLARYWPEHPAKVLPPL